MDFTGENKAALSMEKSLIQVAIFDEITGPELASTPTNEV